MIDKVDFYHGAALVAALEDQRCCTVARDPAGYLINQTTLAILKYTTKGHSPWQFTFSPEDLARLLCRGGNSINIVIALVCGGDGICAFTAETGLLLLDSASGWIRVQRRFRGWYGVSGPAGKLEKKVAQRQWPEILF